MDSSALNRFLAPLRRRIALIASRCVIRLLNDGLKCQEVQISLLSEEVRNAERFQNYGFSSVPLPGAEGIALSIGGDRGHLVVIAAEDRRYRPINQAPGEVSIYTHEGTRIHLRAGGEVHVDAATKVYLHTPLVECSGDLVAANVRAVGTIQDAAGTMAQMRTTYNSHVHGSSVGPSPVM